jgi:hypothetical protein
MAVGLFVLQWFIPIDRRMFPAVLQRGSRLSRGEPFSRRKPEEAVDSLRLSLDACGKTVEKVHGPVS